MEDPIFQIEASGLDVEQLVRDIQERVQKKIEDGVYTDARIARAERANLTHLKKDDAFLGFYLTCLRDAVSVDISDFEIRERRQGLAPLFVRLKKTIWKLLKFYTYRLWSQQNQVNHLLVTGLEGIDEKYEVRMKELEERIKRLEGGGT